MEGNDFAMWFVLFNVRAKESPLGTQVNPQMSSATLKTISSGLFFFFFFKKSPISEHQMREADFADFVQSPKPLHGPVSPSALP